MKRLDLLSEKIQLNYKSYLNHPSSLGSILSIIVTMLAIAFGVYSIRELWEKKVPSTNILNTYTPDAGIHKLDTTGLNHFITILNFDGSLRNYDDKLVNVQGYYFNLARQLIGVYTYRKCEWDILGMYFEKVYNDRNEYENSFCIKEFFNPTSKDTVTLTKENKETFPYPSIDHGTGSTMPHESKKYYQLDLLVCQPSEKQQCYDEETLRNLSTGIVYKLVLLDKKFDVTDYLHPIQNEVNQVDGLTSPNSFTNNNLNLNPSTVDSDEGVILESKRKKRDIYVFQNEKIVEKREGGNTDVLSRFYFFLKNQETIYFRSYPKLQDILANIGGFFNFIYYSALILNYFPGKYVCMYDAARMLVDNGMTSTDDEYDLKSKINAHNSNVSNYNLADNNNMSSNFLSSKINNMRKKQSDNRILHDIDNKAVDNNECNNNKVSPFINKNSKSVNNNNNDLVREDLDNNNKVNNADNISINNSNNNSNINNNNVINNNNIINNNNNNNNKDVATKIRPINYNQESTVIPPRNFLNFSFSYYDMICFACTKKKIFKLSEEIREKIISEENMISMFVYLNKTRRLISSNDNLINDMNLNVEEIHVAN